MSKKIKITIRFFIIGVIIICSSIFLVSHLKGRENEKDRIRNESERIRIEGLVQTKYNELIQFAKENTEPITSVSEFLIKKGINPDNEFDYKYISQSESEKLKQDFGIVFEEMIYDRVYEEDDESYAFFRCDSIGNTSFILAYFSNGKKIELGAYGRYGEVTKITDNIYVTHYSLPMV